MENEENKRKCSHCDSKNFVKNGTYKGNQRYLCKNCKRYFSDIPPKHSLQTKLKAVKMYLRNGGLRAIADIFGVSNVTILQWVRQFRKLIEYLIEDTKEKLASEQDFDIIEMDEIYTYSKKNKTDMLYGLLFLETKIVLLLM